MLKSPFFKGYCKRWEVNKSIKVTLNSSGQILALMNFSINIALFKTICLTSQNLKKG